MDAATAALPNGTAPPVRMTQQTLLDTMIPGFSVFSSAVHAYLGVDLNLYIPLLLVATALVWAWQYLYDWARNTVTTHLMSSVCIRTDDEAYNIIMAWVVGQSFSKRSRNFIATTNVNSQARGMWRYYEDSDSDESDDDEQARRDRKQVHCTPSYGSHFFMFRGHPLLFERRENRDRASQSLYRDHEEIYISCFGRTPAIIKDLLAEARQLYVTREKKKTIIYRGSMGGWNGPGWRRCMTRTPRPFSTVILNESLKRSVIDDIADYLDPATRIWYANRGIPYRRGYLLHGPPGTGKSSLSLALAGYFEMKIYILSLNSPSATEENVANLFSELPRRCIVLLEDIDSAGLTHSRDSEGATTTVSRPPDIEGEVDGPASSNEKTSESRISLSGLLNILDGVASQEGRVLIMTTNHVDKLDRALIRPGRIDMSVEFGNADPEITALIFRAIYAPFEGEVPPSTELVVVDGEKGQKSKRKDVAATREDTVRKVGELADVFAAKIPPSEFSPAEIQGLLLQHKRDPLAAIDAVDDWIVTTRRARVEKAELERRQREEEAEKKRKQAEEDKKKEAEEKKKKKEERKRSKRKKSKKSKRDDKSDDESGSESGTEGDDEDDSGAEDKVNGTNGTNGTKKETAA